MKIRKDDYREVLDYLIQKREGGEEYVAFLDGHTPVNNEELFTFFIPYDVQEFCHEMSTDKDTYNYLAIRSAYKTMQEAMRDDSLLIEKDGIVDVGLMVFMRYQQLETELFNNNQKSKMMNQKNFEYLRDQVLNTGFGKDLENDLKMKIEEGKPEFKLQHQTQYGNDSVTATLNFSQSKQSDMYFFNSYQVGLQKENSAEKMEQTIYINKGNNITLKEAYNLMDGRSVNKNLTNKEGDVYNAWVQMNFKHSDDNGNFKLSHYHQNYGYDLEAVLSKHPIKEMTHPDFKESLMKSLKKGNLQSVTFQTEGAEQKHYIEANPQYKTINIYDSSMQRLDSRKAKSEKQVEGEGQSVKQDAKKEKQAPGEDDSPDLPKAASKKRKKQTPSV